MEGAAAPTEHPRLAMPAASGLSSLPLRGLLDAVSDAGCKEVRDN